MSDLQALEDWVAPLIERLSDRERRQLAATLARDLRRQQVANIKAQRNPDGSPWEPRKQPLRNQRGQIRSQAQARKQSLDMFAKLRSPAKLKAKGTPNEAVVGFVGMAQRIARVHHFGLEDRVNRGGPVYRYPARELLGVTDGQVERVREMLLRYLNDQH